MGKPYMWTRVRNGWFSNYVMYVDWLLYGMHVRTWSLKTRDTNIVLMGSGVTYWHTNIDWIGCHVSTHYYRLDWMSRTDALTCIGSSVMYWHTNLHWIECHISTRINALDRKSRTDTYTFIRSDVTFLIH